MNIETITSQSITVDHGMSLRDMIAAGKYDWTNHNITAKKYPVEGAGIVRFEPKVFHFDRYISSDDAVDAIKANDRQNPWEPAKIEHLLAYGAKDPEEQRQYPIIALGSIARVNGRRGVPYLFRYDARRDLYLYCWDDDWDGYCRFLAVRKLSSAA